MALRLQCTITLLHPYNGHIPRIFPDVHVISISQHGCGTAQKGPQLQAALFVLIDEDWDPLITRHDACVTRSPEYPLRRAISALALGIGFIVPDVLSSCTFGDRPEGGVPNIELGAPAQARPYAHGQTLWRSRWWH